MERVYIRGNKRVSGQATGTVEKGPPPVEFPSSRCPGPLLLLTDGRPPMLTVVRSESHLLFGRSRDHHTRYFIHTSATEF